MSDPCVICENLAVGHDETIVVSGINFSVQSGGITAVVGPSGCGKTTLLRHIAGFYEPDAGKIWFDDEDVTNEMLSDFRDAVIEATRKTMGPEDSHGDGSGS